MKNNIIKYMACAAMALGLAATVQAAQINGSIGFNGTFVQNGGTAGNLTTATSVTIALTGTTATGDFSGPTLQSLLSDYYVNASSYGPLSPGGQVMWQIGAANGKTYTFTVTSEVESLDTPTQLALLGTGTISDGILADNTVGNWELTLGANGASLVYGSTTATAVPDGGMTVMLLGAALSGLALIRRKLA
jgi:hypothetical protein